MARWAVGFGIGSSGSVVAEAMHYELDQSPNCSLADFLHVLISAETMAQSLACIVYET